MIGVHTMRHGDNWRFVWRLDRTRRGRGAVRIWLAHHCDDPKQLDAV